MAVLPDVLLPVNVRVWVPAARAVAAVVILLKPLMLFQIGDVYVPRSVLSKDALT